MPMHPGVPGHGTPDVPGRTPNQPSNVPPAARRTPDGAPHRPPEFDPAHVRRTPDHPDAGNDPHWDDPLNRQRELDRLKPAHLRPEPGKPRTQVDPHSFVHPDPLDVRLGELRDSVGDPPVRNPENWVGRVNPDNLRARSTR